jgi:hypothetical protein
MPEARKRPCTICRRWFRPNPRVGNRQRACGNPECQTARRQKTQAEWRGRNQGYPSAWRIDQRAATQPEAPEPLRMPAPLNRLPWDVAKDQFGPQGTDFIAVMGALMLRTAKDQIRPYLTDPESVPGTLPRSRQKTSSDLPYTRVQSPDHAPGVFTSSTCDGSTCECASRTASAGCWRRWLKADSDAHRRRHRQRRRRPLSGDAIPVCGLPTIHFLSGWKLAGGSGL